MKTTFAGALAAAGVLGIGILVLHSSVSSALEERVPAADSRSGASAGKGCNRAILSRRPAWSASAAFTEHGELLVIDQMYNKVLRYSSAGESLGTLPEAVEASIEGFFPITVKPHGSNVMFELAGDRVSVLDRSYLPLAQTMLSARARAKATGAAVNSTGSFVWQPSGENIVSFSGLETVKPNGTAEESCGFVRFPINDPFSMTVLAQFPMNSPLRFFNRLGMTYLATLATGEAFTLQPDDLRTYRIYRLGPTSLEQLPVELPMVTHSPSLPPFDTKKDYEGVMAAVERSTMPTALVGWGDSLFVVVRSFNGSSTTWSITKLDPRSGQLMGTATIPTTSNHLTVAPGPTAWAFIEKGPVNAWNEQQVIPSILFVDADRFSGQLEGDLCGDQ